MDGRAYLKSLVLSAIVLGGFAGCDSRSYQNKVQEESRQRDLERQNAELDALRKATEAYVVGKLELFEERLRTMTEAMAPLKADVAAFVKLSARYSTAKSDKGVDLPRESRVLHLIRDAEVNAMAVKYLAADFSREALAFVDNVRTAREDERRYQEAIAKSDESYRQNLEFFNKWAKESVAQRESEVKRLQQEIASHEEELKEVLKTLSTTAHGKLIAAADAGKGDYKERKIDTLRRIDKTSVLRYKVKDLELQIKKKRAQIDFLRNPTAANRIESRAMMEVQVAQERANRNRTSELYDLAKYLKPKKSVADVVTECEQRTVCALQNTMASRLASMEKDSAEVEKRVLALKEAKLAIPLADKSELQRLRTTLEK